MLSSVNRNVTAYNHHSHCTTKHRKMQQVQRNFCTKIRHRARIARSPGRRGRRPRRPSWAVSGIFVSQGRGLLFPNGRGRRRDAPKKSLAKTGCRGRQPLPPQAANANLIPRRFACGASFEATSAAANKKATKKVFFENFH